MQTGVFFRLIIPIPFLKQWLADQAAIAMFQQSSGYGTRPAYRRNRAPNPDGQEFWMTQMDKGFPLNKVVYQLLTSPASVRSYGDNTNGTQFVTQLYQNVLDREPKAAGLQSRLNVVANGISRARC